MKHVTLFGADRPGPSLDRIEVYNRTTCRVQTVTKRSRFAVTAGAVWDIPRKGFSPLWV